MKNLSKRKENIYCEGRKDGKIKKIALF